MVPIGPRTCPYRVFKLQTSNHGGREAAGLGPGSTPRPHTEAAPALRGGCQALGQGAGHPRGLLGVRMRPRAAVKTPNWRHTVLFLRNCGVLSLWEWLSAESREETLLEVALAGTFGAKRPAGRRAEAGLRACFGHYQWHPWSAILVPGLGSAELEPDELERR